MRDFGHYYGCLKRFAQIFYFLGHKNSVWVYDRQYYSFMPTNNKYLGDLCIFISIYAQMTLIMLFIYDLLTEIWVF